MDLSVYPELVWAIPEPVDVPLGTSVPVEVTHYDSPIRLFLKYDLSSKSAGDWVCNAPHLYSVYVGMFCLVRCEAVGKLQRAQITDVHWDANGIQIAAEVLYVDRGDVDIVGLDAVFPIDEDTASTPTVAVPCCIRKLRPTPRSSRRDLNEVCSYCEGSFEAVFHGVSVAGVFDIDLFFKSPSMGRGMKRIDVADLLVAHGFASYLLYPVKTFSSRPVVVNPSQQQQASLPSIQRAITSLPSPTLPDAGTANVCVTHVNTPEDWYAQLMSSRTQMKAIEELLTSQRIEEACAMQNIHAGLFCIYREPTNPATFRAQIEGTTVTDNGEQNVLLSLIDLGEKKIARPSCLYVMDEELSKYPPLALHFSLYNVQPWGVWTETAACRFKAVVQAEHCISAEVLTVSSCCEEVASVTVFANLISRTAGSIADLLIREGYARRPTANKNERSRPNGLLPFRACDPMNEDYESYLNSYRVDTDDPGVATMQYATRNERNVCRFFSQNGYCRFDDRCSFRHVRNEGCSTFLRDTEALPSVTEKFRLPKRDTLVLAQMSSFVSPSFFYLIFPYGTKEVRKLFEKHRDQRETLQTLMQEMQLEYSRRTFSDSNLMHRACGEIVAAYSSKHEQWQRAQVVTANDEAVRVTYPDFGDSEWVAARGIRDIKEQFLHLPFQAVKACIADYALNGANSGDTWSDELVMAMASGKVLLAEVRDIVEDVLHVSLFCYEGHCIEAIGAQPQKCALSERSPTECSTNRSRNVVQPG